MGQDKALLELAGVPLIGRAVERLEAVCSAVFILSGREELRRFGTLVADLHPDCGPMGGMEAGLTRAETEWSLFLAVDMPFVPTDFIREWVQEVVASPHARLALFTVGGVAQPTLCLLHREVLPWLERAIGRAEYKLFPVLERAGRELSEAVDLPLDAVFVTRACPQEEWFANLNTPEEFAQAERVAVMDAGRVHHKERPASRE